MDNLRGKPVTYMQLCLRKLSCFYPIEKVAITGLFDSATKKAVEDFQKQFNIKVNGEIDGETYQLISEKYEKIASSYEDLPTFWDNSRVYVKGDKSPYVAFFQSTYNIFSEKFSGYKPLSVTSVMDEETVNAVANVQRFLQQNEDKILSNKVIKGLFSVLKVDF